MSSIKLYSHLHVGCNPPSKDSKGLKLTSMVSAQMFGLDS